MAFVRIHLSNVLTIYIQTRTLTCNLKYARRTKKQTVLLTKWLGFFNKSYFYDQL